MYSMVVLHADGRETAICVPFSLRAAQAYKESVETQHPDLRVLILPIAPQQPA